ncbi:hypothetical protein GQ43DRAFT_314435 [Delitschia confertaspora ATCC 74209]|uniref:Uncharacterized protein n=1 Tax=Delitschia confertaspora ATCC 74209 TaxID=1513339 RepID=A0A9P4JQ42_9PLEO|nr:hypothetical protein GQ43DRAFT_314435 [Delitschia confertaspora ATCC 74209]
MAGIRSLNPTCEDYDSEESESVRCKSTPASEKANVAAKRSHPDHLNGDKSDTVEKIHLDLASDSGYSSHTATTMSSADSAPSVTSQSPPVVPAPPFQPPPSPAPRRRPTLGGEDRKSSERSDRKSIGPSSPRKPPQRTESVSRRPSRPERREEPECRHPNCDKCTSSRSRRPRPSPLDSSLNISYAPSDQQSHASEPARYTPSSPLYPSRNPSYYTRGSAVIQPAASSRRRSSSTAGRPVSYHGDAQYPGWSGMPYGTTPTQDRGPPPSMSAHYAMQQNMPIVPQMALQMTQQMPPYGMMGPPPSAAYFTASTMPTASSYDNQRSQFPRGPSAQFSARRASQYGPPLLTQELNKPISNNMSARHGPAPPSARRETFPTSTFESDGSDSESSEEEEEENHGRALMLPQKMTRRPSLRRPHTTQVTQVHTLDRMSQSQPALPERPKERDPRTKAKTADVSRASSTSRTNRRPSLVQKPHAVSYDTGRAQVLVEPSRSRRRESYVAPPKAYEVERKSGSSKLYHSESTRQHSPQRRALPADSRRRAEDHMVEARPRQDPRRRAEDHIEVKPRQDNRRRGEENIVESRSRQAEAYQRELSGGDISQFTDQTVKAARRTSRIPSGHSDDGSSHSRHSGDRASRISQSNRTTVTNATNGGNGELRLRIDASAPVQLQLNGDMDGRTISFNPAEGGMTDLVISSSARGTETVYSRSERGSIGAGRRLITRREEEDDSAIRSQRSSRIAPDPNRRPLQRRPRDRMYDED